MSQSILHVSLIVSDTERSLRFYQQILGFSVADDRPDLGFPGAWINIGKQQIHLLEVPNPDPTTNRPIHGGRDRHVAIGIANMSQLTSTLEENRIPFTKSSSGRSALFCRDPDSNTLEFIQQTS